MATWATLADVIAITGRTITEAELARGNYAVEDNTGRLATTDPRVVTGDDAEWIKRAVAYQSVWMKANPDLYDRLEVTQIGTGNTSTALVDGALVLGPLAAQALRRCSWSRSRTIPVRSGSTNRRAFSEDSPSDAWGNRWEAM